MQGNLKLFFIVSLSFVFSSYSQVSHESLVASKVLTSQLQTGISYVHDQGRIFDSHFYTEIKPELVNGTWLLDYACLFQYDSYDETNHQLKNIQCQPQQMTIEDSFIKFHVSFQEWSKLDMSQFDEFSYKRSQIFKEKTVTESFSYSKSVALLEGYSQPFISDLVKIQNTYIRVNETKSSNHYQTIEPLFITVPLPNEETYNFDQYYEFKFLGNPLEVAPYFSECLISARDRSKMICNFIHLDNEYWVIFKKVDA